MAVASEGAALVVRLNATGLQDTGWYECVWVADGQTRSAGSFRAPGGVVKDVELRVAQPQGSSGWDLQVIAHRGTSSQVVRVRISAAARLVRFTEATRDTIINKILDPRTFHRELATAPIPIVLIRQSKDVIDETIRWKNG